jgi:type II secretory pathway component PulF
MALELQTAQPAPTQTASSEGKLSVLLNLKLGGGPSVSGKDRMFFTEQLGLLLETGSNLHNALQALEGQAPNGAFKAIIQAMLIDISEGRSFSYALGQHPEVFADNYVNLIAASESGGFIHEVLNQLLEMEEKREELRSTLMSAFSYPAFLLAFSVGVVIFVLTVVFPKFGPLFVSIADQLPATTRILMAMSDGIRDYWVYLLVASAALVMGGLRWCRSALGRLTIDQFKLRIPLIKDIFAQLYLIQAMRVLSLSLTNGVPMIEALRASREVVDNIVFKRFIDGVHAQVLEGQRLAYGFEQADFIPATVKQMIATAEESGSLAKVMLRLADYYERELGKRLATFARLVEPLMLLVMGTVVGLLVSSLILPIFKLSRAVS